jgi:hypothetical protein
VSLAYIRDYYGVPARKGQRVRYWYDGNGEGVIIGSRHQYLRIRFDGATRAHDNFHPTFGLHYLGSDGEPMKWWAWKRDALRGGVLSRRVRVLMADPATRERMAGRWYGPYADREEAQRASQRLFWGGLDPDEQARG